MRGRWALVERTDEIGALEVALASCSADGSVVVIEGPAGIGKSRLLDEVRKRAAGFEVLVGSGGAFEADIAFGVVRQLFEPLLARLPPTERDALLADGALPAAQLLGFAAPDVPSPLGNDLGRVFHGLFWLVTNLAERRPLLLAVDDIHWADDASLRFLVYLGRRLEGVPTLVVTASRDAESRAHEEVIAELTALATVVHPTALTTTGVAELVGHELGVEPMAGFAEACRESTGGNPFLLRELLASITSTHGDSGAVPLDAVRAAAPSTLGRSILLRLGRLGEPARRLAIAAAILGDGASLRHAAALADVDPETAVAAADDLLRAAIFKDVHPIHFEHSIVRASIAADVLPGERAAAHRRAAELLHADGAPFDRVVPYLLDAPPHGEDWAVALLRHAAQDAAAKGVTELAARYLRRAIDEQPPSVDAQMLLELSVIELNGGAFEQSTASAREVLERSADPVLRAQARLPLAYSLLYVAGAGPALDCLDAAVREAAEADPQLALLIESELVQQASLTDVAHPCFETLHRHMDLSGATSAERGMLAAVALDAVRRDEPAPVVRELAMRALGDGRLVAEQASHPMAFYNATLALLAVDGLSEARAAIELARVDAVARGLRTAFAGLSWVQGLVAHADGYLADAELEQRACIENAVPTMVGIGVASLALVLLDQGDAAAARAELANGGLLGDERPIYVWGPYVRGCVRLAERDAAGALADFEDVGRHATEIGGFAPCLPWEAHIALARQALGDPAGAQEMASAELLRAQRRGVKRRIGLALWVQGVTASGATQLQLLHDAVDELASTSARMYLARAQHDLGVALLRAGHRKDGRLQLERSYDGARACGARGLARRAYDDLTVAGARPRRAAFSGLDSLTARERRVAEMVARGLTNREVAHALFVTPKTVENHLGRVYTKLAVTSRRELGAALEAETRP